MDREDVIKELRKYAQGCRDSLNSCIYDYHFCKVADWHIEEIETVVAMAIGWAYADCCGAIERGEDPGKTDMAELLQRAKKDFLEHL